jgi:hypothetical protein
MDESINRIDRRSPYTESRRSGDCFPNEGAVVIAIGAFSLFSMAIGVAIGAWMF